MSDEERQLVQVSSQLADVEKKIQQLFKKKTPKEVIKLRKGAGGKMFPYVPIDYTLSELDKNFGIFWEFITDDVRITNDQIIVRGRLVIKSPTGFSISRPGVGRAKIKKYKENGQSVDEGNDEKAATSDAIKKAASLFGVASDIYYKELEKYEEVEDTLNETEEKKNQAMSKFFAVAKERGFDAEHAKARIKAIYKVEHMEQLTANQIDQTITTLEKYYEIVENGEEPRKIGEQVTIPTNIKDAIEPLPTIYTCKGKLHDGMREEDKPKVPIGEFCSEECKDSYYPLKTRHKWEKKESDKTGTLAETSV